MAGGDLDGDTYFVTWNKKLVPGGMIALAMFQTRPCDSAAPEEPMPEQHVPAKEVDAVSTEHVIDFFLDVMCNDNLGQIGGLLHAMSPVDHMVVPVQPMLTWRWPISFLRMLATPE